MISGLRQEDAMIRHFVHEAVFLRYPSRPDSASQITERLGLSYACEGISPYSLDEIKNLTSGLMISGYPVGQILQEIPIDNDLQFLPAHPFLIQCVTAVGRGSWLPLPLLHSDEGPPEADGHWQANASDGRFPVSLPTHQAAAGQRILCHA